MQLAKEVRQDLANVTQELVGNRERIMFQLDLMDRTEAVNDSETLLGIMIA